nr:MAG TPA: hypothetical protein [Bacteriophage sp.]
MFIITTSVVLTEYCIKSVYPIKRLCCNGICKYIIFKSRCCRHIIIST